MKKFWVLGVAATLVSACASTDSVRATKQAVPETVWDGSAKSEMAVRYRPVAGTRGMVVSDDRVASEWGAEVLRQGGNAVDAAVATALAMAVTRPHYASLGGGGFMVYCPAPKDGKAQSCHTLDYREESPAKAHRDMYIIDGKARGDLSLDGATASGVPGVPAGLMTALEKFGTMPRQKLLTRPIELARKGYLFSAHSEAAAKDRWNVMNPEGKRIFGCGPLKDGLPAEPCEPGALIKQPDLAKVLETISKSGAEGFYKGWVAKKIADGIQKSGGYITEEDLAHYRAKWRDPVRTEYRGNELVSMGPPSAGGATALQMFEYAELAEESGAFDEGYGSARSIQALTHAMSLAFADRAEIFGDPDHVNVPIQKLLSQDYIQKRWKETFKPGQANWPKSAGLSVLPKESPNTTHFSVVDRHGNAVAITTTVNNNFGSAFVPPGTGVVMNDEMDDFSIQPGVPNLFGLVGTEANAIGPRKRPLSSMSPTIVRDAQGNARLVIGAQGGPRITTAVFLALFHRLRFNMGFTDAVIAPRFHHQWKPMTLMLESNGFSAETREALRKMGYDVVDMSTSGKLHAIERFPNGRTWGVPDPRAEGAAVAE